MAATAGAIRQGRAFVELFTDDTKLAQGLRKAEGTVKRFGASVSAAGAGMMGVSAVVLAPLGLAAREYAKTGTELKLMADRTGVAVESLSALKYAASQTGASMEDLEKGIRLSQKLLGSSLGAKTLSGLGIDAAKLKALSPEQQFLSLADAVSKIPVQADKAAAAMKLFGRGGVALLPMLNQGREGIARLYEAADKKGLIWSTEDAENAAHFSHGLSDIRQQVARLVGAVGASLVPTLTDFGTWLSRAIPQVRAFIDEHRGWITQAAKAAVYAVTLGAALWAVGKVVLLVSGAFAAMRVAVLATSALFAVLTGGSQAVLFLTGAVQGLRTAMVAARSAVMGLATASGIAEAVVAIWPAIFIAALAAVLHFTGGFREMGEVTKRVMGGMSDAIAAGDITLAMKILWAGVRVVWTEGVNSIIEAFYGMFPGLLKFMGLLSTTLLTGFSVLAKGIHSIISDLSSTIASDVLKIAVAIDISRVHGQVKSGALTQAEGDAKVGNIRAARDAALANNKAEDDKQNAAYQRAVDASAKLMVNQAAGILQGGGELFAKLEAETAQRKSELAALVAKAKAEKAAMMVNPENPSGHTDAQPDVMGAAARADSVAGGFDVGALMSFQAGESQDHLKSIVDNTAKTVELLEEQNDADDGSWGN